MTSTTQQQRSRSTRIHPTSTEMITTTQEKYLVYSLRIKEKYRYTLLKDLRFFPGEIEQKKKCDGIFLERFDREEKVKERDGIRHVRKPKTMRKA